MSQKSYLQLVDELNAVIPDNTLRLVKPANVRNTLIDILDSVPVVSGTPTEGQSLVWSNFYNAFIGSGVVGTGGGEGVIGSGLPGGSLNELQYNAGGGNFGGAPITYDTGTDTLTFNSSTVFRAFLINGLGVSQVGVDVNNGSLIDFNGQSVVDWGDGNFNCNGSGLFTNNIVQTDKFTTLSASALGTSQDNTRGLFLTNPTSAINNAQQISPAIRWRGSGFKTTGSVSQTVDFRAYVLPDQGTNAGGFWKLQSSVNGGAFTDRFIVDTSGNLITSTIKGAGALLLKNGTGGNITLEVDGSPGISSIFEIDSTEIDILCGAGGALSFNNDGGVYISPSGQTSQINLLGNNVYISGIVNFEHNVRQIFNPGSTKAGMNVGSVSSDPSNLIDGDLWHTGGKLRARVGGTTITIGPSGAGGGGGDLLSTNNLSDLTNSGTALSNLGVTAFGKQWLATTTSGSALNNLGVTSFAKTLLANQTALETRSNLGLGITDIPTMSGLHIQQTFEDTLVFSSGLILENTQAASVSHQTESAPMISWIANNTSGKSRVDLRMNAAGTGDGQLTFYVGNQETLDLTLFDDGSAGLSPTNAAWGLGTDGSAFFGGQQANIYADGSADFGNLGFAISSAGNLFISGDITFNHGKRYTFNPSLATPGFNPGSVTADPTTPINGDLWYNSTSNLLKSRINGATTPVLVGANNLSELSNSGTALTNLGVTSFAKNLLAVNSSGNALDVIGFTSFAKNFAGLTNASGARSFLGVSLGTGDLVSTNNLSDLTNSGTALTNLGVTSFAKTILANTTNSQTRNILGLGTGDSPSFTGINGILGNSSPTSGEMTTLLLNTVKTRTSVVTNSINAISAPNNSVLDVASKVLYDSSHLASVAFDLRQLANNSENMVLDWTTNVKITGIISFEHGVRQTFNPSLATAGFNVGSVTADPTSLSNADLWYNSTSNLLKARVNGTTGSILLDGGVIGTTPNSGEFTSVLLNTLTARTAINGIVGTVPASGEFTSVLANSYQARTGFNGIIGNSVPASGEMTSLLLNTVNARTSVTARIIPKFNAVTSSTSWTPNSDTYDIEIQTALAGAVTINAPSGSPTQGKKLLLRIKDNSSPHGITWASSTNGYRAIGVTLPSTTVAGKTLYVGCVYNSTDSKWDVVAVAQEA